MPDDGKILISRNGEQLGSFEDSDIRTGLVRGTLLPSDHYWKHGMDGWKTLAELFPQLCNHSAPPPPRPPVYAPAAVPAPIQTVIVHNKVVAKSESGGCGSGCANGCGILILMLALFAGLGMLVSEPRPPAAAIFLVLAIATIGILFFALRKHDKED